jgi:phosphoglycolate phosphatase-like HAD superfamily hydrolase
MDDRYVFDLDNTLIMTDELNNESYNYALAQFGISPITTFTRITREVVFDKYPNLTEFQKSQIVESKQSYFMDNIHSTHPNTNLIYLLQSKKVEYCVLWTSADKDRVRNLLTYYRLENNFISIVYSRKRKVSEDIQKICEVFGCTSKQLLFFEDDTNVVKELRLLGQRVFTSNLPNLLNRLTEQMN